MLRIPSILFGSLLCLVASTSIAWADGMVASPLETLRSDDWTNGDFFGDAVSIDGDTAVVGARNKTVDGKEFQGAAYVFVRSGSTWTQQQQLLGVPDGGQDMFGSSVAISGDTIAVGSPRSTAGGKTQAGIVYLFHRSGTTWSLEQQVSASNPQKSGQLGSVVQLDGDTLVASVSSSPGPGWAHVFSRSGSTWSETQLLGKAGGGGTLALQGNTIALGVTYAVEMYTQSGSLWTYQQDLPKPSAMLDQTFGGSVAVFDNTVFVGSPGMLHGETDVTDGWTSSGSAYVYQRDGSTWTLQQELTATHPGKNDGFGFSVALSNGIGVVDSDLFASTGSTWTRQLRVMAAGNLAMSGDTVLFGVGDDPHGVSAVELTGTPVAPPGGNGDGDGPVASSSSCSVGAVSAPAALGAWASSVAAAALLLAARRRARRS